MNFNVVLEDLRDFGPWEKELLLGIYRNRGGKLHGGTFVTLVYK